MEKITSASSIDLDWAATIRHRSLLAIGEDSLCSSRRALTAERGPDPALLEAYGRSRMGRVQLSILHRWEPPSRRRLPGLVGLGFVVIIVSACSGLSTLDCGSKGVEEGFVDYSDDTVGHRTIEEAVNAFRSESDDWLVREDWKELTLGDTQMSPVEYTDAEGRVYLSVEVVERNDLWLVTRYQSCSPS